MDSLEISGQLAIAIQYCEQQQLEKAETVCRHILEISPNHEQALNLLGGIHHQRGNFTEAVQLWQQVLTINPQRFITHYNLGVSHYEQELFEQALLHFTNAVNINPDNVAALTNQANSLLVLGRYSELIDVYQKLLIKEPNNLAMLLRRANLYLQLGQHTLALHDLNQILRINPQHLEALNNSGLILTKLMHYEEAIKYYEKAISINPNEYLIWLNKAAALSELSKEDEAIASYKQAVVANPNSINAKGLLLQALQEVCQWQEFTSQVATIKKMIQPQATLRAEALHIAIPFLSLLLPTISAQEQLLCAQQYSDSNFSHLKKHHFLHTKTDISLRKLKIGYLSGDYRRHAVSQLMAEVFELHDSTRFTITAFSYGINDGSQLRQRIEKAVDHFIDISTLNDQQAAQVIYDNQVDILVDLAGYTALARTAILALKPAPIQISYLGYLGTSGASFIDYLIADDFLIHSNEECYYSEKIIRLHSYQANDSNYEIGPESTRQTNGLPENSIVFCCFNMMFKITPDIFNVWCKLLTAVPDSVLWLYTRKSLAIRNLKEEASRHGIDPNRLIFAPMVDLSTHLSRLQCADIFLDTHPYNAGTTASNALWVGLPVVTYSGETFASRMAGSLLTALDVPELITYHLDDYYKLALELATNTEKRELIRQKILKNKTTTLLFDSKAFTKDLEKAFLKVWEEHK